MKTKKSKSIFRLAGFALAAVICAGLTTVLPVKADAAADISSVKATMDLGASVRLPDNAQYSDIGIKYTYFVSADDYNVVKTAYPDAKFGVFIAPADWHAVKPINDATNLSTYYTWGENKDDTKAYILNVEKSELAQDAKNGYRFDGAVVNMKTNNLLREYVGIGYIKYGDNYIFATPNDNARSMVYIAQRHIAANGETEALKAYFNDTVLATDTTYSVEHLVKQGDGTYKLYGDAEEVTAKVNGTATATAKTDIPNYAYETANTNNQLKGTVYANGKTTLKLYYTFNVAEDKKEIDAGLIETSAQPTLSTGFISGLNYKLEKVVGTTSTVVENFTFNSNGDIDLTKLSGMYKATASAGEEVIQTVTFDAYNKYDKFEYNNDLTTATYYADGTNYAAAEHTVTTTAMGRTGSYLKINYTPVSNENNKENHYVSSRIQLAPAHSKGYYELYKDEKMTFDYYIDPSQIGNDLEVTSGTLSLIRINSGYVEYSNYKNFVDYHSQTHIGNWYTAKKDVSWVIENYDKLISEYGVNNGQYFVGFCNYITINNSSHSNLNLTVYVGDFNIELSLDSDVKADTANASVSKTSTSLDMTTLLGEDNKALATKYAGYVETKLTDYNGVESRFGSSVDVTKLEVGVYDANVTIGATEILNGSVYVYESGAAPIWNSVGTNTVKYVKTWCNESGTSNGSNTVSMVTFSEDNKVGDRVVGNYFKIRPTENFVQDHRVSMLPAVSKQFYEEYLEDNPNAKLTFDIYLDPDLDNVTMLNCGIHDSGAVNIDVNKWKTCSVELSKIIANWDTYGTKGGAKCYLFRYGFTFNSVSCENADLYIGNFRIESGANA